MAKTPAMGKHVEPHIPEMNYIEALAQIRFFFFKIKEAMTADDAFLLKKYRIVSFLIYPTARQKLNWKDCCN